MMCEVGTPFELSTGVSVGLEENPGRGARVHALDLLGCAAEGPSPEAALEAFTLRLSEWLHFLGSLGLPVPDPAVELEIRVDEWVHTDVEVLGGESDACFGADLRRLGRREIDAALQRFGDLRGRHLREVRKADPVLLDLEPDGGWSARRILDELARAEWWTLSRLGASPLAEVPERTLGRLDTAAALVVATFTGLPDEARGMQLEMEGETWTARKVLRRLLWLEWTLGGAALLTLRDASRAVENHR